MLARLAVRNVRRSARDYAVYFVTLLFGVAVFYAFNSIDSQAVLFDIEKNAVGSILEMTNYFIGLFSVAVAVVLAFLVTYANRFIIKRRKREFGTYLLLGMSASRVACVLSIEMLVVGAVSLVVGLVVGLVLSQALAFATAALMGTTMTHYTFVVSTSALVKTLICFAILFAAALVMNVVFVSRRKVGDLLAEH
ncbi:MAG: FtsX-like permease family protein, partial [Coriobacteriaceae bacterium]|nr:FtsX-like permease family protein [Coriobacteriaceae bacterium]